MNSINKKSKGLDRMIPTPEIQAGQTDSWINPVD